MAAVGMAAAGLAGMLLGAAAPVDDHAVLGRVFAGGRPATLEGDRSGGKAAVYRPTPMEIRIDAAAGEGCESRFASGETVRIVDWRTVRRIELDGSAGQVRVWIVRGPEDAKLIVGFDGLDAATRAARAMERLQAACGGGR